MDISGVLAISGKPGLYKVVGQSKNTLIVQSLIDGRRFPASSNNRVSSLEEISIYTYEEDLPLADVFEKIFKKLAGKEAINHKSSPEELRSFMQSILPDYDENRVYNSDIKKLIQWYNSLLSAGILKEEKSKESSSESEEKAPVVAKTSVKKPVAKTPKPVKKVSTSKKVTPRSMKTSAK